MNNINIEERVNNARMLHRSGCNCCQSVVLAFADCLGIPEEKARQLASSFGRGMQQHEVCGCVSGMYMVVSLAGHPEAASRLAEIFRQQHGAIVCRTLLGLDGSGIHHKPCNEYVASAAQIVAEYFAQL